MTKIAINGFGRIGKSILRAYVENPSAGLEIAVINAGRGDLASEAHLLKYDSTHGALPDVSVDSEFLVVGGHKIPVIFEMDASKIDWQKFGVDIVFECTGTMTKRDLAAVHLASGARKVMVSAPCENADATVVMGVNHEILNAEHSVISIGSCTTNCLAPVAKILHEKIGIRQGFMTTIHAYTNDQNLLDSSHNDLRRARAAGTSMIPSSTGAAKALGLVLPELAGKLDGVAMRIPTSNVSFVDLTFEADRKVTADELNKIVAENAASLGDGVLEYVDAPLVSIDFNHNVHSSSFDATQTKIVGDNFCRVGAWYDNEWGFSNRMLDVAKIVGSL